MRTNILQVAFFLIILTGCEKESSITPDMSDQVLSLEIESGNNQNGAYNKQLDDSLVVKVINEKGEAVAKVPISFRMSTGDGDVSIDWALTDSLGQAYTQWTIGCYSDYNELTAYLLDSLSNKLDSVIFSASGSLPDGWGKACGGDKSNAYSSFFRENNGILYFVSWAKIFTSGDGGISWQELEYSPFYSSSNEVFDVQFNSKGWMYILTKYDGVYYTEDFFVWKNINIGILDHRYPTTLLVEDTCLFVGFQFDGLYRSTDNGQFWQKLLINGKYTEEYSFIQRHPNGDLYLFDKWETLWHSTDNGDNWTRIKLDYKYIDYELRHFIIDQSGNMYLGSYDARISTLSSGTYQGTVADFEKSSSSDMYLRDMQLIDGVIYSAIGNYYKVDIYTNTNWQSIGLGFDKRFFTFHLKDDGTFLLAAEDGVYYYNSVE